MLHTFEQFDTIKIYYKIFNQTLALFRLKNSDANKKIERTGNTKIIKLF